MYYRMMCRDITIGVDVLEMRDTSFFYTESPICICTIDRKCSVPSGFFIIDQGIERMVKLEPDFPLLESVSGFVVGCFPVESLLQSTLECLFDSSCLENIRTFIPSSNITGVYALNTSQTRFAPNTFIEIIINNLFVEKWLMKPSFSNYYAQCAPILCTYTILKRKDSLYVLTKLLGLYGGLTATLSLCVPVMVAWWRKRRVINSAEPSPSEYRNLKSPRRILLNF
jgi:hypothetical protein